MLKNLTQTFKDNCNAREVILSEYVVLNNIQIPVKAELNDDCYDEGNFIGTFIFKELRFETSNEYDFRKKEFEYYKMVGGESVKIGTFITTEITDNDTEETIKVVAMDYGLKTQVEYTSQLNYGDGNVTLLDVWNENCEMSGLESGITSFTNSDFIVDSDQFSGTGATRRDVFIAIAQSSCSFVKVMNDDKIYLLLNEYPKGKAEGTNININDSADAEVVNYKQYGITKQETTTGKNLLNNTLLTTITEINGITATPNSDGSVKLNGTALGNIYINLSRQDFGTENMISGSMSGTYTAITGTIVAGVNLEYNGTNKYTYIRVANATTLSNVIIYPMVILSSITDDTYEPYTGGQPSPNPDYPQEIEVATGSVSVKSTGKNLFDIKNTTKATITTNDNTNFTYIPTANGNNDYLIDCDANTSYTISMSLSTTVGGDMYIYLLYTDNTEEPAGYIRGSGTLSRNILKTSNAEKTLKGISVRAYNIVTYNNYLLSKPMLEKGSSATDYEPYKESSITYNLGDNFLADKDYIENGVLNKNVGKVVVTNGNFYDGGTWKGYYVNIPNKLRIKNNYLVCDRAIFDKLANKTENTVYENVTNVMFVGNADDTLETLQQKFNGAIIYYELAIPEQIQLETTGELRTFEPNTIITNSLDSEMEVEYNSNNIDIVEDYTNLDDKRDTHEINAVRLGLSNVDGNDATRIKDGVDPENANWLEINDNPFAYTIEKREQLIDNIFNKIKDFGYSSFKTETSFKPYLTCGDLIKFKRKNGVLVNTILLRYKHNFDEITLEAPSIIKASVNYIRPKNEVDFIKRVEIKVDRNTNEIEMVSSQTQNVQDNLNNNYYTINQTNTLIQNAETGVTNTFSEAGGNNILRNTGLWFESNDTDNPYEFWLGKAKRGNNDNATNYKTILLQNGSFIQEQEVPNGNYSISFWYKKLISQSVASVVINDKEYQLDSTDYKQFYTGEKDSETNEYITEPIVVTSGHIKIEFKCDADNGVEVYDLMCNKGSVKLAYSQNQNETTTDTVNISKGITITSSNDENVKFKADYDGIRTLNKNGDVKTRFTDKGMETDEAIIRYKEQTCGTLIQEVGDQTWFTRM